MSDYQAWYGNIYIIFLITVMITLTHSTHSLTPLTHSLMRSVKHSGKLATATALLLWWKCLEFRGKKPFTILNAYVYALASYSFSFGGHCLTV